MATEITNKDTLDRLLNVGTYIEVHLGDDEETTPVVAQIQTLDHLYELARERDMRMVYTPFDVSEEDGAVLVRVVEQS